MSLGFPQRAQEVQSLSHCRNLICFVTAVMYIGYHSLIIEMILFYNNLKGIKLLFIKTTHSNHTVFKMLFLLKFEALIRRYVS